MVKRSAPSRPDEAAAADRADDVAQDAAAQTVEALDAVVRAAIHIGREVLDTIERTLDDPAVAQKLAELVAGATAAVQGLGALGATEDRPAATEIEHIEVT